MVQIADAQRSVTKNLWYVLWFLLIIAAPFRSIEAAARTPNWINVLDYGATGNGVSDDTNAFRSALNAAKTSAGGYLPVYIPAGTYRITSQLVFPSNVTIFGDGSRPGNQGGSEIAYWGPGNTTAVVAGQELNDWSNSQLRGFRISGHSSSPTSGYGIQVINPTNGSIVSDIIVYGFPDGQIYISNGSGGTNPGPNFFKLANFFCWGGKHPLHTRGGRQQVLIDFGGIDLDATSTEGMFIEDGEASANVYTVIGVKIEGNFDVPGFYVNGMAPVNFMGCTRYNNSMKGTKPAFLLSYPVQPDLHVQLLGNTALGTPNLVSAPEKSIQVNGSANYGNNIPYSLIGRFGLVYQAQ